MKRLIFLLTLIGILSIPFEVFAKSPKQTTTTIKYKNGGKYVGEIKKVIHYGQKMKYRHGNGVMYYANGDSFDGGWDYDSPFYGTYQYINGDCFKGSLKNNSLVKGQFTFAHKGCIKISDKIWEYPASSSFDGELKDGSPFTGSFDCALTNTTGDKFTGTIKSGQLDSGTILFVNGDIFEGSFIQSAPSSGKYSYSNFTEIAVASYKWIVPAGCTFDGDVRTLTGTVDTKITDINGNQFIGKLAAGQPDEGTMNFANGTTETGKWHDGLSPKEYEIKLKAETKAWLDARRKAREAQQQKEEQAKAQKLAQEKQKQQKEEQRKKSLIQKYGQRYGSLLYQGKLELGMTQRMCQEIINIKSYDIGKSILSGHRIETWTFNKDKQDMQIVAAMTQLSGEEAMALALLMGFADSVGVSTTKYSVLVFTDGKLTSLY